MSTATKEKKTAKDAEITESDTAAETEMNQQDVETVEAEAPEAQEADGVPLPENPYKVLMEIMKHPADAEAGHGENEYEIQKETASVVFPDKKSAPSLFNAAKKKLEDLKIIKTVKTGTISENGIVQILEPNVTLRVGGQGRKVSSGSTSKSGDATPRRRGRPRNDGKQPAESKPASRPVGRPKATATPSKVEGGITIERLREKLMPNPERIEKYIKAMTPVLSTYKDIFESQFQEKTTS